MHSIEWILFAAVAFALLAADLFVVHRKARVLTMREASRWTAVVVATALLFGLVVLWRSGPTSALEYYAGYLVELSLSVDNLFVFILIFQYFAVPPIAHSKVLNWGVFGAAAMRGIMVVVGTTVLGRFDWLFIILGVVLLFTAARMFKEEEEEIEPDKNPLVKIAKRLVPMTPNYEGARFFIKSSAGWLATPLFVVVLVIEWTDVVFAIDSIPAILSITRDPFIVYTSNIFAILGLRAMFFVIQDAIQQFRYLKPGVGVILAFVGLKMIFIKWFHLPVAISLGFILTVLVTSIVMSIVRSRRSQHV